MNQRNNHSNPSTTKSNNKSPIIAPSSAKCPFYKITIPNPHNSNSNNNSYIFDKYSLNNSTIPPFAMNKENLDPSNIQKTSLKV